MVKIRRILIPTDLNAKAALPYAQAFANRTTPICTC